MIQLVFAQSIISRDKGETTQKLRFGILVKNLAYEKQITVHWAGVDNKWHQLPAFFSCQSGGGREQWYAETVYSSSVTERLPGTISFALQYSVSGMNYWDNNHNSTYFLSTDTGLALGANILLSLIDYNSLLPQSEIMQIVVASHWSLLAQRVFVRWTTDNWRTYHQTLCTLKGNNSIHKTQKVEPNPGSNKISLWTGHLRTRKAFKVEYAIGCVTENGEIWDNNFGCNYISSHNSFKLLTLNLHCYQEQDQDAKFTEITRAISEIDIDIICLQEVGEVRNDTGQGEWRTNAARIIRNRLRERGRYYHLYKDWSHIGFDRYQEGSAILSKYPFLRRKAAYVSTSKDINSIHARKIVMAQVYVPAIGIVNVFSVHLSWWSEGFREQFETLRRWADEEDSAQVAATLLCGDFNIKAGSQGYMLIVDDKEYEDQFLRATSPALFAEIFKETLPKREMYWADDDRIDYIYANKNASLHPVRSKVVFSGQYYRRVSDHVGYLTEFEPEEIHTS
ncbi:endonuclease/exonuclease/phosphatase family protein [Desulfopila sp. IMCC35008]|uniref:endonuclease/exonuclease/phosphatase family protein n=1 Tax=Desulfopila sp. IMCC35008 TaxID=2653858 RepID=UPI0013D1BAB9|nr:endonuclease/exonuclease/phosphatase family protein [Desulfopila sp. IMCC35008]